MYLHMYPDGVEVEALSLPATGAAAGALCDLGEGEFEQHVFLVIHDVHASPVHGDDHLVLWQAGTGKPEGEA